MIDGVANSPSSTGVMTANTVIVVTQIHGAPASIMHMLNERMPIIRQRRHGEPAKMVHLLDTEAATQTAMAHQFKRFHERRPLGSQLPAAIMHMLDEHDSRGQKP